jgi:hypothetical protein
MDLRTLAVNTSDLDRDKAEKVINEFKGRYGINAKAVDHRIYMDLAGFFSAVFPLVLAAVILLPFIKKGITVRNKPFLCSLYVLEGLVFLLAAMWISKAHFVIPESMTPNRWSDFDFWRRISEEYFKDVQQMVYSSKQKPEIDYLVPMIKAAGCSLSSVLLFYITNLKFKMDSSRKLFILLCISLIMEFTVIIMINFQGLQLRNSMMFWLMYPLYLIGKYKAKYRSNI